MLESLLRSADKWWVLIHSRGNRKLEPLLSVEISKFSADFLATAPYDSLRPFAVAARARSLASFLFDRARGNGAHNNQAKSRTPRTGKIPQSAWGLYLK